MIQIHAAHERARAGPSVLRSLSRVRAPATHGITLEHLIHIHRARIRRISMSPFNNSLLVQGTIFSLYTSLLHVLALRVPELIKGVNSEYTDFEPSEMPRLG